MLQMLNFILRAMGSQPGKNFEQRFMENQSKCKLERLYCFKGLPGGSSGLKKKKSACQCRRKRHRFDPQVRKISWRRAWQATPVFLPGESHGQRSLAGQNQQGCKESGTTEAAQHACMHTVLKYRFYYHLQMVRATDQETGDTEK